MPSLPSRPSLESLRKQAKTLLRRFRDGAPEALAAVRDLHPKPDGFSTLRDAQLVIARGYGFRGWSELTAAVETAIESARTLGEHADRFADLACLGYDGHDHPDRRERATRIREESPGVTAASVWAAAAAFDVAALRSHLDEDTSLANRRGGPRRWPPLMYLSYSRAAESPPDRDALPAARLLLDHGADPRFHLLDADGLGGWRWTALTGAIGNGESGPVRQPPHPRARELAELLLDAGADPNDSQALYNCHFSPDDTWLELLLSHGLTATAPANPDAAGEETTLDFLLAAAVRAGYTDRVRLLLQHGANASGRDDRYTHHSFVQNAVLLGKGEILDLLVEHGAPRPRLSRVDRFRMAVTGGDVDEARRLLGEDARLARQPDLLVSLAQQDQQDAVGHLLELGADPNELSAGGRGALHEAAWAGHRGVIDVLLAGGASLELRSRAHGGTPVGYAHYAGRLDLRDALLDRSADVFDLVVYDRVARLEVVLADDPAKAHARNDRGATVLAVAKEQRNDAAADLLRRHGATD